MSGTGVTWILALLGKTVQDRDVLGWLPTRLRLAGSLMYLASGAELTHNHCCGCAETQERGQLPGQRVPWPGYLGPPDSIA